MLTKVWGYVIIAPQSTHEVNEMSIEQLSGKVQAFAIHLTNFHTHKHLHSMINRYAPPKDVCEMWELSEDEYLDALEAAYFFKLDEIGY